MSLPSRPIAGAADRPPTPPVPVRGETIEALVTLARRESSAANLAIVRSRLVELGPTALPWLERAVGDEGGETVAALALEIRRRLLITEWGHWTQSERPDLETGALLIDRFGDPSIDGKAVTQTLDGLAGELGRRLRGATEPDRVVPLLTGYLFQELGFRGNTQAYEEPENSYLSHVLTRRLGIPVSLSVVVLLLAQRLDLPFSGIGMPGHFIVRHGSRAEGPYLDVFGGGRVLSRSQCVEWLRSSGFEFNARMLRRVGPREIAARMLRNLIATFTKRQAVSEVEILSQYLNLLLVSRDASADPTRAGSLRSRRGSR